MTIYDTKNTQLIWCNRTLGGFGSQKITVTQSHENSFRPVIGLFGEYFYSVNPKRCWTITSEFLVNSESYRSLEWDNLMRREGSLIIRDLNLGTTDIFYHSVIASMPEKKDSKARQVIWTAVRRNYL